MPSAAHSQLPSATGLQPGTAVTMICWGSNQMPLWRRSSTPSSANLRRRSGAKLSGPASSAAHENVGQEPHMMGRQQWPGCVPGKRTEGQGVEPEEAGIVHSHEICCWRLRTHCRDRWLHPDSDPANPDLHSQFVKLNEAYRVLSKESSRRRYDFLRTAHRPGPSSGSQHSSPKRSPFDFGSSGARREPEPNENIRYWQQFHARAPESSGPELEHKQDLNRKLFGYCLLLMLGSLLVHYVAFRKLEEVHTRFMDEKDRTISQIYNENKERARSNGLQKQQELLRRKRAEFDQHYSIQHGGLSPAPGALDSVKDPASPSAAAK